MLKVSSYTFCFFAVFDSVTCVVFGKGRGRNQTTPRLYSIVC